MNYLLDSSISIDASTTASQNSAPAARQIVFIDGSVDGAQQLALNTLPGIEAIAIDPTQDGIAQITATLASRSNISSVHLIGHGSSGSLRLGSTVLDRETLAQYADSLNQWKTALTADADLLLYGCNVAADPAGQAFVDRLSQLTDADVAASDDLTGNAAKGGDWQLEYATGSIEAPLALQEQAMQGYQDVLGVFSARTEAELRRAINNANFSPDNDLINILGSINLTSTLPTITSNIEIFGGVQGVTINGPLNGATGVNRLFKVTSGNVSFRNLFLQNGVAQGATGLNGGGGGLGAGGALFVENATVEFDNVRFRNNTARGGDATGTAGRGGNGGNLGFGGDNGAAGGRGGGFDGSAGGAGGAGGLNGSQANLDRKGGRGGSGVQGGFGEGGGGGGGGGGGQSVFFLFGSLLGDGGSGGFGGLGGFGAGNGGGGGGGGSSDSTLDVTSGGDGGPGILINPNGFGSGSGNGTSGAAGGPDADVLGGAGGAGGRGGGGAGLGGAIFARNSNVTIRNSLFENNTALSGFGFSNGQAAGADIFNLDSSIRLQNNLRRVNGQISTTLNTGSFGNNVVFTNIIPQVSIAPVSLTAPEGGNAQFAFSLDEPAPIDGLTVNFQVEGTATAAGNPNADHDLKTGSVTIPGGQRSFTLNGAIADDSLPELTETLTLQLLSDNGYTINSRQTTATVEIQDNDLVVINGTAGNDNLTGTAAIERINGAAGNDTIDGNGGNDSIFGDAGDDRIVWDNGDGSDTIDGGVGTDSFIFNSNRAFATADLGVDRIVDFVRGSDRIVLDRTTFGNITTSQIAIVANDAVAATNAGLITYSQATGNLFFNQNGATAGFGTGGKFATLQGNPALTVNNFQIVA